MMRTRTGAITRHTDSTETGPRARTSQDRTTATSPNRLTAAPVWEISTPKTLSMTFTRPCPNMMASTADHAAAKSVDITTITIRAPLLPNTLRRPTNCSMPYFADGRHGASETRKTLIA